VEKNYSKPRTSVRGWFISKGGRKMLKEFKAFVMRGSVMDLAIAVVIGTAFTKIVTSLVKDILMPPIGLVLGKVDFSNLFVNASKDSYSSLAQAQAAGAPTINYGLFITAIVDFLIVTFVLFIVIRMVNRIQQPQKALSPLTKECPYCMSAVNVKATRCPNCTSNLKKD
jgi:large conductance mechanosensitive channel